MTDIKLYIDDTLVDLPQDVIVENTIRINTLAELKDQQTSYTNTFKLPFSEINNKALGYSNITPSEDRFKAKLKARLFKNDVLMTKNGVAVINSATDGFDITVYSDSFDFFNQLDGEINELDVTYDGTSTTFDWDQATAAANPTDLFPVIQMGELDNSTTVVDVRYMNHSILVSRVIDAMFTKAGFTKAGSIFSDPLYTGAFLPFSNKELLIGGVVGDEPFSAEQTSSVSYTTTQTNRGIICDTLLSGNAGGGYSTSTGVYVANQGYTAKISASGSYSRSAGAGNPTFKIRKNSIDLVTITPTGTEDDFSLEVENTLVAIDAVDLVFSCTIGTFESIQILEGITFTVEIANPIASFGASLTVKDNLPKITQRDLFKTILNWFAGIVTVDKGVVTVTTFDEIAAKKDQAIDWSDKIDFSEPIEIDYSSDYAQINNFRYKDDTNVTTDRGKGQLLVVNENLPKEKDELTLKFAACDDETLLQGVTVAKIDRYVDPGSGFELGTFGNQPRIVASKVSTKSLDYTDGTTTTAVTAGNARICYFVDASQTKDCGFESNLRNHYDAVSKSLNKGTRIILFVLINESDIANLDFTVPVYISAVGPNNEINGYFYIAEIKAYRDATRTTQVVLVKL